MLDFNIDMAGSVHFILHGKVSFPDYSSELRR